MSGYVLIVDSDEHRASARVEQLQLDGASAQRATRPSSALQLLASAELVVLGDIAGSAAASLQLLREIRAGRIDGVHSALRAIALADGEAQILSAYGAGADMTLPRNASGTLLSASVDALMRRHWRSVSVVRLGELEVNRAARSAAIAGQPVKLTAREFALLDAMAQAPGRVFTRDELSREVWGAPHINGNRAIDTYVSRITRKLRDAGAANQRSAERLGTRLQARSRQRTMTATGVLQPIMLAGRLVALVAAGQALITTELAPADEETVKAMCLFAIELHTGQESGPYTRDPSARLRAARSRPPRRRRRIAQRAGSMTAGHIKVRRCADADHAQA